MLEQSMYNPYAWNCAWILYRNLLRNAIHKPCVELFFFPKWSWLASDVICIFWVFFIQSVIRFGYLVSNILYMEHYVPYLLVYDFFSINLKTYIFQGYFTEKHEYRRYHYRRKFKYLLMSLSYIIHCEILTWKKPVKMCQFTEIIMTHLNVSFKFLNCFQRTRLRKHTCT